jgi:hypothetical protein
VIPVALIHLWLLLHWPSVAGPAAGVLGILIAIVAHRRAARAVAECTALINGSIGSRGTVDPRASRDLAVVRYDALSEMSGQLSFSVALLNALGAGTQALSPEEEHAGHPEVTVRTRRPMPAA